MHQPVFVECVHLVERLVVRPAKAGAGRQVGVSGRRERTAEGRLQRRSQRSRSPGASTVQIRCFATPGRHYHRLIRKAILKDTDDDGVWRNRDNVCCSQR